MLLSLRGRLRAADREVACAVPTQYAMAESVSTTKGAWKYIAPSATINDACKARKANPSARF